MEIFEFLVDLRLRHPTIDPKEISRELGILPSVERRAGDQRMTPQGDLLGRINSETYWTSQSFRGVDEELLDMMANILVLLESRRDFLTSFIDGGGKAEIYVSWFSSKRSGGLTIDSDLLKKFGDLRVNLSLDVYGDSNK